MTAAGIGKRKAEEEARNRSSIPVSSPYRQLLNFIGEKGQNSNGVFVCCSPFYVPTNLPFLRILELNSSAICWKLVVGLLLRALVQESDWFYL